MKFQGTWKCVVKSTEINSTWVTNIMQVKGTENKLLFLHKFIPLKYVNINK